ncbi:MAG: phosphohistidine phosphatase SixA [SAR86 cluster bacterium]|uniref:Phosphohistidine phosphatase SixA n=1 Tax=SAR86 cluster bacterium TaxID=2030880 RepID=A0A2A4MHJ7_9GAMM|nr:MAG: phosphohistidine phosphatase SixA [SAR86 cluster bacterium]
MSILLYLMRHGEAEPAFSTDSARRLTARGISQSQSVVQDFIVRRPQIQKAVMSPFARAQETAAIIEKSFDNMVFATELKLTPEGDVNALLSSIESFNVPSLLLVSHNPLMSKLLSLLVNGNLHNPMIMGTSHLACVSMDVVAPGCATLEYLLEP